jgi:hypothetical protein
METGIIYTPTSGPGPSTPSLSDYAVRDTTLFGAAIDPDVGRFYEFKPDALAMDRRITKLETSNGDYNLTQANSENDYAGGRWEIPRQYVTATDIKISSSSAGCETLYLKGSDRALNKITDEYDYSAPAVGFAPSGDMEVYMVPTLIAQQPIAGYQASVTPALGIRVAANVWWGWWDRYHFIERPEIYCPGDAYTPPDLWTGPAVGFGNVYLNPWDTAGYLAAYPGFEIFKHYDGARAVVLNDDFSVTITTIDAFLNPAQFPVPPSVPTTTSLTTNDPVRLDFNGYPRLLPPTGTLTGIIRKGEKLYYFWSV